jgi:hypothetical protein
MSAVYFLREYIPSPELHQAQLSATQEPIQRIRAGARSGYPVFERQPSDRCQQRFEGCHLHPELRLRRAARQQRRVARRAARRAGRRAARRAAGHAQHRAARHGGRRAARRAAGHAQHRAARHGARRLGH